MKYGSKKNNLVYLIFFPALGLSLFGLMMIYNASSFEAFQVFGDKFFYVKNQAVSALIGIILLFLAVFFPLKKLKNLAVPLMIVNIVFLVLVLIPGIGTKIMGARRWINLGTFNFQPSELLKLNLCVYLAAWLEQNRSIWPFLALIAFLLGLIVLEPDLGTAIVIITTAFLVYFVSGAPIKQLFLISFFGILLGLLLIFSSSYRRNRITTFLNPSFDPLGKSYHLRQILISLGSGGLWGVGLGESKQKYQYLPEATTDSIFAVIGEEVGFLGSFFLILVYLIFIFIGLKITKEAKDRFSQLLACGITVWIGTQAFINFGAMVSLLPLTGIPLPFISYGGSSLLVLLISTGLLINIARNKK